MKPSAGAQARRRFQLNIPGRGRVEYPGGMSRIECNLAAVNPSRQLVERGSPATRPLGNQVPLR